MSKHKTREEWIKLFKKYEDEDWNYKRITRMRLSLQVELQKLNQNIEHLKINKKKREIDSKINIKNENY